MTHIIVIDECSMLIKSSLLGAKTDFRGYRLANAGAVPHTGKRHRCHYHRRPRGAASVKRVADDGMIRPGSIPPDAWDDLPITANRSRNWKRHRLTKWRDKEHPQSPQYWDKVRARRQGTTLTQWLIEMKR